MSVGRVPGWPYPPPLVDTKLCLQSTTSGCSKEKKECGGNE